MKKRNILLLIALLLICFFGYENIAAKEPTGSRLIVLSYHHFTDEEDASGAVLSLSDFKKQMAYLHENNYNILGLEEFLTCYKQQSFPEKSVMLTFDDGYRSFYTLAYPVLKEYSFKGVIFPVVGLTPGLEREVIWNRHLTFQEIRLMDKESGLIDVGSHSYNLHYYREDGKPAVMRQGNEKEEEYVARLTRDLRLSKDLLEVQTDREVVALAWPYGATNKTAMNIAKEIGYKLMFTLGDKPVTPDTSLDSIPRYAVRYGSIEYFQKILTGGN